MANNNNNNNNNNNHIESELQQLEAELANLTLRVSALRRRSSVESNPRAATAPFTPRIGDKVQFNIGNRAGLVEGVIIGITPQRVRIREKGTSNTYLRAPHKIHFIRERNTN